MEFKGPPDSPLQLPMEVAMDSDIPMQRDNEGPIDHESEVDGCDVKVIHITADEDLPPSEGGVR